MISATIKYQVPSSRKQVAVRAKALLLRSNTVNSSLITLAGRWTASGFLILIIYTNSIRPRRVINSRFEQKQFSAYVFRVFIASLFVLNRRGEQCREDLRF